MSGWNFAAETLAHLIFEECLHLVRRSGQKNDGALASFELSCQPLSASGAVQIWQDHCAVENVSLLGVIRGHLQAAIGEAFFQLVDEFRITVECGAKSRGDGFAREVVFGRTESPAK